MAMITRRFKKFFKKARENSKRKNISKPRSSNHEQSTGCFKCGKHHCEELPLTEGRTGQRTVLKLGQKTVSKQFCKAFFESNDGNLGTYYEGG